MKARLAVVIIALLMGAGMVGATAADAATICLDASGFCNDFKLSYNIVDGEIVTLNGYEYGCGYQNRGVSGTAVLSGSTAVLSFTGVANGDQVSGNDITLNVATGTGTGNYRYISDAYINGTADYTVVPCSTATASSDEPDNSQ